MLRGLQVGCRYGRLLNPPKGEFYRFQVRNIYSRLSKYFGLFLFFSLPAMALKGAFSLPYFGEGVAMELCPNSFLILSSIIFASSALSIPFGSMGSSAVYLR